MNLLFNILVVIIFVESITAITREQATAGTRVRFHYVDKCKRTQNSQEMIRKAEVLNGKVAVIMDDPFWENGRRIKIQSVDNPDIILAVKPYYLELVDPTLADGETRIDLFISRPRPEASTDLRSHIISERYRREELPIANNARYRAVIVNNPRITSQTRTMMSFVQFNRFRTGIHRRHLTLSLLDEGIKWLEWSVQHTYGAEHTESLRDCLIRCIRIIWDREQESRNRNFVDILESEVFTTYVSPDVISMMYIEYLSMQPDDPEDPGDLDDPDDPNSPNTESIRGDAGSMFTGIMLLIRQHLLWTTDTFQHRLSELIPKLNIDAVDALTFYDKQNNTMQGLFVQSDSEFVRSLLGFGAVMNRGSVSDEDMNRAVQTFTQKLMDITKKTYHVVESIEYYLAVGELLVHLRDSGEAEGRIAVNCVHGVANGDWIRAISAIMGCQRGCVSLRMM